MVLQCVVLNSFRRLESVSNSVGHILGLWHHRSPSGHPWVKQVRLDPKLFKEVHTTKHGLMRIYQAHREMVMVTEPPLNPEALETDGELLNTLRSYISYIS